MWFPGSIWCLRIMVPGNTHQNSQSHVNPMVFHALGGHNSWNEIRSSRRNLFLNPRHLVVPNARHSGSERFPPQAATTTRGRSRSSRFMPPSLASTWGMPNKGRSFHDWPAITCDLNCARNTWRSLKFYLKNKFSKAKPPKFCKTVFPLFPNAQRPRIYKMFHYHLTSLSCLLRLHCIDLACSYG